MKRTARQDEPTVCHRYKMGEYNDLRCFRPKDHEGECQYTPIATAKRDARKRE